MRTRLLFAVVMMGFWGFISFGRQVQLSRAANQPPPSMESERSRPVSATQAPIATAQPCKPGEGWRWTSGDFLPDVADEAKQMLQRNGFVSTVTARSFGETDSCGLYYASAVDFVVKLEVEAILHKGLDRDHTNRSIGEVLERVTPLRLGVVQIEYPDGQQVVLRPPTRLKDRSVSVPDGGSSASTVTRKVYVVVYDPILSNGQYLSDYLRWNEHTELTSGTVEFFAQASGGGIDFQIVQTTVLTDGWPEKIDGFRYTEQEYLAAIRGQAPWHYPDAVNYNKIVNDPRLDICGKVNRGEIDEVWIYNGPGFGFYESTLVGPGAYWFNSPPVPGPHTCNRLVPIMGPSPERGLDCAIENFGHRTEATMTRVYGSWQQNRTTHNWEKFALVKALSPNYSYSGCGNVHYPPNGVNDYDYGNPSAVNTNCDDFFNYPNLGEPSTVWRSVTCSAWSCDHLLYFDYWFRHLPRNPGCGTDRVANNWWQYFSNPALALDPSKDCLSPVVLSKSYLPIVLHTEPTTGSFCDRFDGSQLDPRWSLIDPLGGSAVQLLGGSLFFSTPSGGRDLYGPNTNAPRLLQSAPTGDWNVMTYVRLGALGGSGFQTAGLLYWVDASHYVWFGIGTGNAVQGILQSDIGRVGIPWIVPPQVRRSDLFVRLQRISGRVRAGYSTDGLTWNDSADMEFPQASAAVGLVLINAWDAPAFSASFGDFLWNWCR